MDAALHAPDGTGRLLEVVGHQLIGPGGELEHYVLLVVADLLGGLLQAGHYALLDYPVEFAQEHQLLVLLLVAGLLSFRLVDLGQ